jgi:hypothetical protein
MLSETCARREFRAVRRRPVSPVRAWQARSGALVHITGTADGISSSAPGSRSLVVRTIAAELSINRYETTSAHRLSLVGRRLRGTPPPSLWSNVQPVITVVFSRVNRSPIAESWQPRKPKRRASERSRPGRRGVSSEGAAGASAAARRRGAASRKATLQARAPEEDIPRRPRAMGHRKARCRTRTDLTSAYRAIG